MKEQQSAPTPNPQPSPTAPTPSAASANPLWRDLLIPISIVLAGGLVGLGLYFGGGTAGPGNAQIAAQPNQPAERPQGNLEAFDPVTESDHIKGNPDASVVIIEYSDYDCAFCSRFHDTMNAVVAERGDEVAWVYRHFPLEQLHPNAPAVAVASECVADLGGNDAFWTFTDGYFAARSAGDETSHAELIPQLVTEAGVAQAAFTECFESGEFNTAVQADVDDAVETGGRGTPWSIVVGPDGSVYPLNGAQPRDAVEQLIDIALEAGE